MRLSEHRLVRTWHLVHLPVIVAVLLPTEDGRAAAHHSMVWRLRSITTRPVVSLSDAHWRAISYATSPPIEYPNK